MMRTERAKNVKMVRKMLKNTDASFAKKTQEALILRKHVSIHGPTVKGDELALLQAQNESATFAQVETYANQMALPVDDLQRKVQCVFSFRTIVQNTFKQRASDFEETWKHITQHGKVNILYDLRNENLEEYIKEAVLLYHKELENE